MQGRKLLSLALVMAGMFACCRSAVAQAETYMKMSTARGTILGESTNEKHKDWIEVKSFSYGASGHASTKAEGARQPPRAKTIVITKYVDKSSEALQRALAQDTSFSEVDLESCKGESCPVKLVMHGVMILSLKIDKSWLEAN